MSVPVRGFRSPRQRRSHCTAELLSRRINTKLFSPAARILEQHGLNVSRHDDAKRSATWILFLKIMSSSCCQKPRTSPALMYCLQHNPVLRLSRPPATLDSPKKQHAHRRPLEPATQGCQQRVPAYVQSFVHKPNLQLEINVAVGRWATGRPVPTNHSTQKTA